MDLIPELPLARATVARTAHLRSNPHWFDELGSHDATRVVLVHDGMVAVTNELSLHLVKPSDVSEIEFHATEAMLLGVDDEHVFIALVLKERDESVALWATVRDIGATLSSRDVGLAITATALSTWHARHKYCPQCGQLTDVVEAGWARKCVNDGQQHFPRTEPAVIVAVEDRAGRLLLGRRTNWTQGWFSLLAGFVEAGESCESAVIREVHEESGIHLDQESLKYLGSQPWPFPASLMLAYRATARTTDLIPDGDEIAELKWVTVAEFKQECESGTMKLPNPSSIAWHVIERWFGQPLSASWTRG